MTTELTSSVRAAGPILQALAQAGVDFEQVGARLGIDPSVFADRDARMPISKLLPLWDVAEELLNDPFIGLHLAQGASRESLPSASAREVVRTRVPKGGKGARPLILMKELDIRTTTAQFGAQRG